MAVYREGYDEVSNFVKQGLKTKDYNVVFREAQEILKKTPGAKVLFVSAEKRVEKEALEAGAIGFFTKPTSIRTLLTEIDRIQKLQTEKLHKLDSKTST